MNNTRCLAYIPDPFAVQASLYCLYAPGAGCTFITARQVGELRDSILTYDVPSLVDDLRRNGAPPPQRPVDISEALRLLARVPRDEGRDVRENVWKELAKHFGSSTDARRFEGVVACRDPRPDEATAERLTKLAAESLSSLWNNTRERLDDLGEFERFDRVEVPLQGIFGARQHSGIAIDRKAGEDLLRKLSDERYRGYAAVAATLDRSPTGLNFWNIAEHLERTDAAHLDFVAHSGNLRDAFKLASATSAFARNFLMLADAGRDEEILKRMMGEDDNRTHPTFQVFGTVTGRIMASDPQLQHLRRRSRRLISPDPGMRLVYLDYSQFEPGVLAFLSADRALMSAYNDGDLYIALSKQVFGRADQRSLSKRMFLAYCYGMSAEGIAHLVTADDSQRSRYCDAVEHFFSMFAGLIKYRESSQKKLLEEGSSSSLFGNFRVRRTRDARLTSKECRWAVNHPVQATASLVFKEALIALAERFGVNSIVLPVHDAVLAQFSSDERFDDTVAEAEHIMAEAFARRCPGIKPRVSIGEFSTN